MMQQLWGCSMGNLGFYDARIVDLGFYDATIVGM